jgi:hypothetical protein
MQWKHSSSSCQKKLSHKHPQSKEVLTSLTMSDPCFYASGLNLVTKSMATVTAKHFNSSVQGSSTNMGKCVVIILLQDSACTGVAHEFRTNSMPRYRRCSLNLHTTWT